MQSDFIQRHRNLSIAIAFLIGIALIALIVYGIFGNSGTSSDTSQQKSDPTSALPFKNFLYSISTVKNNTITITAGSGYRNAAVDYLTGSGYDVTKYNIVFTYESPFTSYVQ